MRVLIFGDLIFDGYFFGSWRESGHKDRVFCPERYERYCGGAGAVAAQLHLWGHTVLLIGAVDRSTIQMLKCWPVDFNVLLSDLPNRQAIFKTRYVSPKGLEFRVDEPEPNADEELPNSYWNQVKSTCAEFVPDVACIVDYGKGSVEWEIHRGKAPKTFPSWSMCHPKRGISWYPYGIRQIAGPGFFPQQRGDIVTLGEKGGVFDHVGRPWGEWRPSDLSRYRDNQVDATGAGDTFFATLVHKCGTAQHRFPEFIPLAARMAEIQCTRWGVVPFTKGDLDVVERAGSNDSARTASFRPSSS